MTQSFTFETTPHVICEVGASGRLAGLCADLGAARTMIVTDPGLEKAGVLKAALEGFEAGGHAVTVFTDVQADPPGSGGSSRRSGRP